MSFMAPSVSNDEIYKRKLLIDGEGMGDDKRLNSLLKNILMWCNTKDETEEEANLNHERLIAGLESCMLAMAKSTLMQKVNQAQVETYEKMYNDLEAKIVQTKQDIIETREALEKAKRVRSNNELYNSLAAVIKAQPSRKETVVKLQEVNKEVEALEKQKLILAQNLNRRYRLFHTLCSSVYEAKQIIKGDEEENNDEEIATLMDM